MSDPNTENGHSADINFQPVTEGLGFHNKVVNLKEEVRESGMARPAPVRRIPQQMIGQEPELDITQPLPREGESGPRESERVQEEIPAHLQGFTFEEEEIKAQHQRFVQEDLSLHKRTSLQLVAGLFDACAAFAFALIFVVCVMSVIEVQLIELLFHPQTQGAVQQGLLAIYALVLFLYLVVSRALYTRTLGEWAFDMHLGHSRSDKERLPLYRLCWRTALVLTTGGLPISLMSFLIRHDLAGLFSGTQLYQKKY